MSLDDLIDNLLEQKAPARTATIAAPVAATESHATGDGERVRDEEVVKLKGDLQRLMLQVKVLKAENDGLKAEAIKQMQAAEAAVAAAASVPAAKAEEGPASALVSSMGATLSGSAFPWKRHIASVEESLRKKQTEIAECALRVLVDVAEVVSVEPTARARLLSQLGGIRLEQGNHAEAERTLNDALALLQSNSAMNSVSAAFCLDNLAQCFQINEHWEEAEKTRRQAVTIAEECLGGEHPDCGYFRERLDLLRQERSLAQIGNDERSRTVLQILTDEHNAAVSAGTYVEPVYGQPDSYSGLMLDKFAQNAKQALTQRNPREAESYLRSALEKAANIPDNDPRKCEVMRTLGGVLQQLAKDNESKEMYEQALTVAFKHLGWHDFQVAQCLIALAEVTEKLGDLGLAKNYYKQAVTAFQASKGREDEETKLIEQKYAEFIDRIKSERQWKSWTN